MNIDEDKIDDAVLALLFLTRHYGRRAWKGLDFNVINRLYEKGYIEDPTNKAKSVLLTDEGLFKSEKLFKQLFSKLLYAVFESHMRNASFDRCMAGVFRPAKMEISAVSLYLR